MLIPLSCQKKNAICRIPVMVGQEAADNVSAVNRPPAVIHNDSV